MAKLIKGSTVNGEEIAVKKDIRQVFLSKEEPSDMSIGDVWIQIVEESPER